MIKKTPTFEFPKFRENIQNKLLYAVLDADLRCGHDGLLAQAKKKHFNPKNLGPGEFAAFLNTRRNSVKFLMSGTEMLGYFRMPSGRKINEETIGLLSKYFNGKEFNYDAALREILSKKLDRKRQVKI